MTLKTNENLFRRAGFSAGQSRLLTKLMNKQANFRLKNRQMIRYIGANESLISSSTYTIHNNFELEQGVNFGRHRIWLMSHIASTPAIGDGGFILTDDPNGWGIQAKKGGVNQTVWTKYLKGGAAIAGQTIADGTGTNPDYVYALTPTDWMDAPNLARVDDPTAGGILMTRWVVPVGFPIMSDGGMVNWSQVERGKHWRGYQTAGDALNSPGGMTATPSGILIGFPEFITDRIVINLAVYSDSMGQGYLTTTDNNAWGHIARALISSSEYPVSWYNAGRQGQTYDAIYKRAMYEIPLLPHDMVLVPVGTVNDALTQTAWDTAWAKFLAIMDVCYSNRKYPIPYTVPVWNFSGAGEQIRLNQNDKCRKLERAGQRIFDIDAILSDGGSPARIKPQYAQGLHMNDLGANDCGVALRPILEDLLTTWH